MVLRTSSLRWTLLIALFFVASLAFAQNRVTNPGFDTGISGWYVHNSNWNPSQVSDDANGSTHSGAGSATVPAGTGIGGVALSQCVSVTPSQTYDLSLKVKVDSGVKELVAQAYLFTTPNCTGSSQGSFGVYSPFGGQANVWTTVHTLVPVPSGVQRVYVQLDAANRLDNGSYVAQATSWDDVYLGLAAPATCSPNVYTLCLDDNPADQRFLVATHFETVNGGGLSGPGNAISLVSEGVGQGGIFWFFSHENPEMLVKVHDACASSNYFWVFVSAGTNAGVDLYVGDTVTGAVAFFHNPDLGPYPSIHNFRALPCN